MFDIFLEPDRQKALAQAQEGSIYFREINDSDLVIAVYPLLWGNAHVCLVEPLTGSVLDSFSYASPRAAIEAAKLWSGEGDAPEGWFRNPTTGRRRENGDPAKETVRP